MRDYAKYNFVTPIIQPDEMSRDDVLKGVLHNYRRFYFKRATGGYLWDRDPARRKYLQGCLKAYLKSAVERRFYDLGRINYWGMGSADFKFDETKTKTADELIRSKAKREIQHVHRPATAGAGTHAPLPVIEAFGHELPADEFIAPKRSKMAATAAATATVGGDTVTVPADHGGIRAC